MSAAAPPRSARAAIWSMADAVTASMFSTLTYLVMTWFIPAAEFGVGMLALAIALIVSSATEMLFSDYIIANRRLREVQLRVFNAASLTISLVLAGLLAVAAPSIERATGAPRLAAAVRALIVIVLCSGVSAIPLACLKRDLAFSTLARRTLVVRLLSCAFGLVLAFRGFGLWALVGQQIALSVVNAAVLLSIRRFRFARPWRVRAGLGTLRPSLSFVGGNFLPALMSGNVNRILVFAVGMVAGARDVGFVAMAARIVDAVTFPLLGGLGQVTLPILSRARAAGYRLADTYGKAASLTSAAAMPVFLGLAAVAPGFTASCLSIRWAPTAAFLSWLALERGLRITCALNMPLLAIVGRPVTNLKLSLVDTGLGLSLLAILGSRSALAGIVGWCAKAVVFIPLSMAVASRVGGIDVRSQARASGPALIASGVMVSGCLLLAAQLTRLQLVHSPRVLLALQVVLGGAVYTGALRLLDPSLLRFGLEQVLPARLRAPADRIA